MSSHRPRGQSKIFVSCGFCQSTSTTNLAKAICGLPFVLRFVTFLKRSNPQTDICSKVVELLDQQSIQHLSVDLVRFSWCSARKPRARESERSESGNLIPREERKGEQQAQGVGQNTDHVAERVASHSNQNQEREKQSFSKTP